MKGEGDHGGGIELIEAGASSVADGRVRPDDGVGSALGRQRNLPIVDWARTKTAFKKYGFLGLLTAVMALLETQNPFLLALFLSTGAIVTGVALWLFSPILFGVATVCVVMFAYFMWRTLSDVEHMERSAAEYDQANSDLVREADAGAEGGYAAIRASMPSTKTYPKDSPLRQDVPEGVDSKSLTYLDALFAQAHRLEQAYLDQVLLPISAAAGPIVRTPPLGGCPVYGNEADANFVGTTPKGCKCTYSRPAIMMGVKGKRRCVEKTRQDYGGDYAQLKDVLRASVIVNTFAELLALFVKMDELEQEGMIVVEQVKNRFLDLDSGYRDANCSIRFQGHVCELQLHLATVIAIKGKGHKYYEAARELGLAGPLPEALAPGTWAEASLARRVCVVLVNLGVGLASAFVATGYGMCYLGSAALMDLVKQNPWEQLFEVNVETGSHILDEHGTWVMETTGVPVDLKGNDVDVQHEHVESVVAGIACALPFVVLLQRVLGFAFHGCAVSLRRWWAGASAGAIVASSTSADPGWRLSRTAALYSKSFGINGVHFGSKVLAFQLVSVLVQSLRLGAYGVMAGVCQAPSASYTVRTWSLTMYWAFVAALLFNCVYPSAVWMGWLSRRAAIMIDASLDLTYVVTFLALCTMSNVHPTKQFSTSLLDYAGLGMPIMHAYTLSGTIITAASTTSLAGGSPSPAAKARPNTLRRLPAAAHALLGLSVVGLMVWEAQDLYPLGSTDCLPCYCVDEPTSSLPDAPWQLVRGASSECFIETDSSTGQQCISGSKTSGPDCTFKATRPLLASATEWQVNLFLDQVYVNGRDMTVVQPVDLFLNTADKFRVQIHQASDSLFRVCAQPLDPPTRGMTCERLNLAGPYHIDLTGASKANYSTVLTEGAFDGLGPHLLSLYLKGTERPMLGTIPAGLSGLTRLQYLFVDRHAFVGTLPSGLEQLSRLKVLSVSQSGLSGTLPVAAVSGMSSLQHLLVYQNFLISGTLSSGVGRLTGLQTWLAHENGLTGTVPLELGRMTGLHTWLMQWNVGLSGTLPSELCRLTTLRRWWLSGHKEQKSQISGSIPGCLAEMIALEEVLLGNMKLGGTIPSFDERMAKLTMWNAGGNALSGTIGTGWNSLTGLQAWSLQNNQLSGTISSELAALTRLQRWDLGTNLNITGTIAPELAALTSLSYWFLNALQLSGNIPTELASLTSLGYWDCDSNQLSGFIGTELASLTSLGFLDLTSNLLSGFIPTELAALTSLQFWQLDSNRLSGPIPAELAALTRMVNWKADSNLLVGTISSEFAALTSLEYWHLQSNRFSGAIGSELSTLVYLKDFRLQNNRLSGGIETGLAALTSLKYWTLHSNQFISGTISSEFASLTGLQWWTLNSNRLSGHIFSELASLTTLQHWYVHSNQLSGAIPTEMAALTDMISWRMDSTIDTAALDALGAPISNTIVKV